jgi:hypothetical protein
MQCASKDRKKYVFIHTQYDSVLPYGSDVLVRNALPLYGARSTMCHVQYVAVELFRIGYDQKIFSNLNFCPQQ